MIWRELYFFFLDLSFLFFFFLFLELTKATSALRGCSEHDRYPGIGRALEPDSAWTPHSARLPLIVTSPEWEGTLVLLVKMSI